MSEMIDRVARAIAAREAEIMVGADPTHQSADPRALARAAIEAMREPTDAMTYSGSWAVGPGGSAAKKAELAKAYRAMIDAALSPEPAL